MTRVARSFFTILLPSLLLSQTPTIDYRIGMSKPSSHLFEVEMSLSGLSPSTATLDFLLPVWRTGRYVIFDFAGGVQEFSASAGGGTAVPWAKTDKSTWRVEKGRATSLYIRYKVYANEFGDRTRGLNDDHAFVDGCAIFMYLEKYRHLPLTLTVVPYQDWHVTTGLESVPNEPLKFTARNLDVLMDSPLEIGHQRDFEFEVEGKKHVLTIYGEANYKSDTIIKDISTIVKANKEFWGDLPYNRYVFMLELSTRGGGGTEHINSTIMGTGPNFFKTPRSYQGFLGLVSHEYFHTWNVKQLRPKGILPYDYMHENYVKELWVAEGTTDYYGSLILARTGLVSISAALDQIANMVYGDRERPGNKIQSVEESSFDAWVKLWKGNQQSYNSETDYYGKGADVSLVLDLEIRQRSGNKHSLDDVMRTLYHGFPLSGGKGYTVDDVQRIAETFAGGSLKSLFDEYVRGTKPIDWKSTLRYAGLELQGKDSDRKPWLGAYTYDQNGRTIIRSVSAGSPAYDAGLDLGDEIVALSGQRVRSTDLQDRISEHKAGETVKVTIFRDDKLKDFTIVLRLQDIPSYKIAKIAHPTELQKAIFESWLKTKWE
jgi:predicted metalloprotease with PDZ domain